MAETKGYKCLNCGAGLVFEPSCAKWKCEYCLSQFDKDQLDHIHGVIGSEDLKEEFYDLDSYHCESCGAQLIADETTTATFCLYCRNPVVIKEKFKGKFEPKYVVPFKITKEYAKKNYKEWIGKKIFAPSVFKKDEEVDKITGIYAPFWLFDCHAHGRTQGQGTKVSHWRVGKYEYTKTKFYQVEREGNISYEKIPVDSATKLDDVYMNMIEPYDYNELQDFSMHYLTGFMAEKYDVESSESEKVMQKRVEDYVKKRLRETVQGYTTYLASTNETKLSEVNYNYALLPVYILVNKYKGKEHLFVVNGQTGKVVGDAPIDLVRQILFFLSVFIGTTALMFIGGVLLG